MHKPGQKIVLRDWIESDFPCYKKWHTGAHTWMKYNGPYYLVKSSIEVENEIQLLQMNNPIPCKSRYVIADKMSNQIIGTVSWYWQSKETNWLSLGLAIYDDAMWGKGIGYEALGLWTEHIFEVFPQIMRTDLRTWSGNIGMMRLAEKCGYQLEARFRNARIVEGVYYDSIGYGMLREEWGDLYQNGFRI